MDAHVARGEGIRPMPQSFQTNYESGNLIVETAGLEGSEVSHDGQVLYEVLECKNWAPWLRFSVDQLNAHQGVFPRGQIVVDDAEGSPAIMLSGNRIDWSGDPKDLSNWDTIAGADLTYEDTYRPDGNTYAMMSISSHPNAKGSGASREVFQRVRELVANEGINHVIGDFRPSGFGAYKAREGKYDFAEYCQQVRDDGLPIDPWLRTLTRQGMEVHKVDQRAMIVPATPDQVAIWSREHKPDQWRSVTDQEQVEYLLDWHKPLEGTELQQVDAVWECGETGTWYIDYKNDQAVYIESNVWGEISVESKKPELTYDYKLEPDKLSQLETELVADIKSQYNEPDIYFAWIKPDHPYSNILRTVEAQFFPEMPNVVDETAEKASLFLAIVDTRDNEDRIVHGVRLSGIDIDDYHETAFIDKSKTEFVVIKELIDGGKITEEEFAEFCTNTDIDPAASFSVETNFRVGERVPHWNGVSTADLVYLVFNRLTEQDGSTVSSRVFAAINELSRRSLKRAGVEISPIPVSSADEEPYELVALRHSKELSELIKMVMGDTVITETRFVA